MVTQALYEDKIKGHFAVASGLSVYIQTANLLSHEKQCTLHYVAAWVHTICVVKEA